MASGSYVQVYVKCPFYSNDNGRNIIRCSVGGGISGISLRTVDKAAWKKHMDSFCCKDYGDCPVYRLAMTYWGGESCKHNDGVVCLGQHGCGSCGWNPDVAAARLRRRKEADYHD